MPRSRSRRRDCRPHRVPRRRPCPSGIRGLLRSGPAASVRARVVGVRSRSDCSAPVAGLLRARTPRPGPASITCGECSMTSRASAIGLRTCRRREGARPEIAPVHHRGIELVQAVGCENGAAPGVEQRSSSSTCTAVTAASSAVPPASSTAKSRAQSSLEAGRDRPRSFSGVRSAAASVPAPREWLWHASSASLSSATPRPRRMAVTSQVTRNVARELRSLYPALGSLGDEALEAVLDARNCLRVPAGTPMFGEGSPLPSVSIGAGGSIRVAKEQRRPRSCSFIASWPARAAS